MIKYILLSIKDLCLKEKARNRNKNPREVGSQNLKFFTKRFNIRIDFSFPIYSGNELNINAPCKLKDRLPALFFDFGITSLFPLPHVEILCWKTSSLIISFFFS